MTYRYVTEPVKCPRCSSGLKEIIEATNLMSPHSGKIISKGSLDTYYASVEFCSAPDSATKVRYLKCTNPECGYVFRRRFRLNPIDRTQPDSSESICFEIFSA